MRAHDARAAAMRPEEKSWSARRRDSAAGETVTITASEKAFGEQYTAWKA
jgi:hypothetical protein